MTEPLIANSLFPDLPREIPAVDKEGNFSYLWSLGLSSLFQALQVNFSNEGVLLPSLNQSQANQITANYAKYFTPSPIPLPPGVPNISGKTIFNTTIATPQVFIISFDGSSPPKVTGARWWTFTIT